MLLSSVQVRSPIMHNEAVDDTSKQIGCGAAMCRKFTSWITGRSTSSTTVERTFTSGASPRPTNTTVTPPASPAPIIEPPADETTPMVVVNETLAEPVRQASCHMRVMSGHSQLTL
jgi:hypothetical protein